jgi:hypothetical protein
MLSSVSGFVLRDPVGCHRTGEPCDDLAVTIHLMEVVGDPVSRDHGAIRGDVPDRAGRERHVAQAGDDAASPRTGPYESREPGNRGLVRSEDRVGKDPFRRVAKGEWERAAAVAPAGTRVEERAIPIESRRNVESNRVRSPEAGSGPKMLTRFTSRT